MGEGGTIPLTLARIVFRTYKQSTIGMYNSYMVKRIILIALFTIASLLVVNSFTNKIDATRGHEEVCFCHNVNHNPHEICTDNDGQINGHMGHVRNGEDIIGSCPVISPTPTSSPSPTPTSSPTPTNSPTPTPTEKPSDECQDDCITPSPSPTPTEKPSENRGSSGGSSGGGGSSGTYNPPVCSGIYASPAVGVTGERIDADSVRFKWWPSTDHHDRQVIEYGLTQDNLQWSVLDISAGVGSIEINDLPFNSHYWARIGTWRGECISWSMVGDP